MEEARFAQRRITLRAVGARIGYGAAWGALPLAGAIAAAASGSTLLAAVLVALVFVASLLVPLAPFLPLAHRLPLIGSPKLTVGFRLNGRRDLTLTTPPGEEHTCLLEVELTNPSRWFAVKDAWINLLIPSGIKIIRCDQFGLAEEGGQWEDFQAHQMGTHTRADYWHDTDLEFPPRLTRRIRVKLRLGLGSEDAALEYPVLLKLVAPSLYSPIEQGATIRVRQGEATLEDQMGKVITTAERALEELRPPLLVGEPYEGEQRRLAMAVAAEAAEVLIPAIEHNPLPETPADVDGSTHFEHVRMHVKALYVVRNELGREAG